MSAARYYRTTRARETGTLVTTAHADDLGLDADDGRTRWYNVCEEHASCVGHASLALARSFAAVPSEWCEECRPLAAHRHCPTCGGTTRWAEDAFVCRECGDEFYPDEVAR